MIFILRNYKEKMKRDDVFMLMSSGMEDFMKSFKEEYRMEIKSSVKTGFEKVLIDEGLYKAKLKDVRDISPGEFGDRIVAVFDVGLKDGSFVEIASPCYKHITPDTKLGGLLKSLGVEITDGSMDSDDWLGRECKLVIENFKDRDGDTRSGISDFKKSDWGE